MADYLMASMVIAVLGAAAVVMSWQLSRARRRARLAAQRRTPGQLRAESEELLERINQASSEAELDRLDTERGET